MYLYTNTYEGDNFQKINNYSSNRCHVGDTEYVRIREASKPGLWDLFLLQDNEYVRIVDKADEIVDFSIQGEEFKLNEGLGEPVDGNIHIDTTIGINVWDNQEIEVGDTVECIDDMNRGAGWEMGKMFVVYRLVDNCAFPKGDWVGVYRTALKLIKKGDVATPVSSDKQVNTKQDGSSKNNTEEDSNSEESKQVGGALAKSSGGEQRRELQPRAKRSRSKLTRGSNQSGQELNLSRKKSKLSSRGIQ